MGKIHLGCSGWDYQDWADVFYKNTDESKLKAYSHIFNTAEINSTFYNYPSAGIVFGWAKHTPQDFIFAVKLNRLITHEKMLDISKGVDEDVRRFCELMKPLQETEKLACILIQLPPGMKFKKDRIEAFLRILPQEMRFAFEYRNETWLTNEAHDLLSHYNVAAVTVDEPLFPPEIRLTLDLSEHVRALLNILTILITLKLSDLSVLRCKYHFFNGSLSVSSVSILLNNRLRLDSKLYSSVIFLIPLHKVRQAINILIEAPGGLL